MKPLMLVYDDEEKMWLPFRNSYLISVEEATEIISSLKKYITLEDEIKQFNKEQREINERELAEALSNTKKREKTTRKAIEGYVYIVKFREQFKIGKTKNMKNRMGEYSKLPEKPEIVFLEKVKDYSRVEELLHRKFQKKRTRGEWFVLNERDIQEAHKAIDSLILRGE